MTAFAPATLPDSEKQALCERLLDEFGINIARITNRGEIHMPCSFGNHQDQDKNPTGSLNYQKLTYKCLGCQASGGLLWFIASFRNSSAVEAREWLGQATGTDGSIMDLPDLLRLFDAIYQNGHHEKSPIPRYSKKVLDPWLFIHPYMTDPIEEGGRGVLEETYKYFSIGYAQDYRVGENKTSERIVIPHFWDGELVGWQTRRLSNDGSPKYLNSPDFPKEQTIYNYDVEQDRAIVVESTMSVLRHWHALPEIVCTFGASVTDEQVRLLQKIPTVILWMDNDEAGWNAVQGRKIGNKRYPGLAEKLAPYTNVLIVENPYAGDPADLDTETVIGLVNNAIPYSVWQPPKILEVIQNGAA